MSVTVKEQWFNTSRQSKTVFLFLKEILIIHVSRQELVRLRSYECLIKDFSFHKAIYFSLHLLCSSLESNIHIHMHAMHVFILEWAWVWNFWVCIVWDNAHCFFFMVHSTGNFIPSLSIQFYLPSETKIHHSSFWAEMFLFSGNGVLPGSTKPLPKPMLTVQWHSSEGNYTRDTLAIIH